MDDAVQSADRLARLEAAVAIVTRRLHTGHDRILSCTRRDGDVMSA